MTRAFAAIVLLEALACPPSQAADAAAEPFAPAAIQVPAVHGTFADVTVEVLVDADAGVGMERTPYWVLFAAGAMAVPLSLAHPVYGLGLLYPVIGPPLNALFEAKRETLIRAVAAEPLPAAVLDALAVRLPEAAVAGPVEVQVALGGYGLATPDGRAAVMFDVATELCLTAQARLRIARTGRDTINETVRIQVAAADPDLPPAICAPIGRFAAADGTFLRQALRELADVVAALVVQRLQRQP